MIHTRNGGQGLLQRLLAMLVIAFAVLQPASAQTVNATLRGQTGLPGGGEVVATEVNTGFSVRTDINADGSYSLAGVRPGSYTLTATSGGQEASAPPVIVQIGQTLVINLSPTTQLESVTVTASALPELRNSEVATNVTQDQIRRLPQGDRNFLAFAALAPGITVKNERTAKSFSAAGQNANQTNVFIDGANLKNNILQGGLVGQDSSRGNPFSQEAVQEFRVLTQNYKAEYEQAGTALITAVTKSGSNEFHGSVWGNWQDKGMVDQEAFSDRRGDKKPEYERKQFGATLGGPIIEDRLQFFVSYEARHEEGAETVNFNDRAFQQYNGTFASPFRQRVSFGKLSWQPSENNNVDLSFSQRRDSEETGFGGTTSYDSRQLRKNDVDDLLLKWQFRGNGFINDMLLNRGEYTFNPTSANPDLVAQDFQGVGLIGGASSLQNKKQETTTFRDDVTFDMFEWHGDHVIKTGIKIAKVDMNLLENNNSNPRYTYNRDRPTGFDIPFVVAYSPNGKTADIDNKQYGIYIQDDWDINSRLQLNLGLRWDYESDAYNYDYVTPADQIPALLQLGLDDYISTGNNREAYKNAWQPRLGFSYDLSADNDQSTTVFGGAGRYYDRTPLDNPIQESFHSQFPYYNIYFSQDGSPVDGNPSVIWDPRYLTPEGLDELITTTNVGRGELNVLHNDTKPPYSDQFSLGVKHQMGDWTGTLTLSRVLGYRQFTWIWGSRLENGDFVQNLPNNYGPVLINSSQKYQSKSILIGIDKPYTDDSRWGVGVAYTFQRATRHGGDAYSLDFSTPGQYPEADNGPKHQLVINGIVLLPWDIRLSTLITYNSGTPFARIENFNYNDGIHLGAAYPDDHYEQVDLALSKEFRFGESQALELRADAFNIFNKTNYACYTDNANDVRFGEPNCTTGVTRSFQLGLRYSF
jgi:outer membrane receptor protein involved in Fe transport